MIRRPLCRKEQNGMMDKKRLRRFDGLKYGWLRDAKKFLLLLFAVFLVFRFVIGLSIVKGDSMEPTLYDREIVIYTRLHSGYQPGDVVSVRVLSGEYYVKRIIAAAGDTVEINDGKVWVNGEPLSEPYVQGVTETGNGAVGYPLTLKDGQIFIMGDNREKSMDSRDFGVVGERQVKGKIQLCIGKGFVRKVR